MKSFCYLLDKIIELDGNIKLPTPWINGRDLIALGYSGGVIFSKILSRCYEAQLNNEIADKNEAKDYILKNFPLV
jgi:hypothetical protein